MTRSAYHGYDTDVFGGIPPLTVRHSMPKDSAIWKNRITGYADVPPDQLMASPANFRRHPKNQQDAFLGVVDDVGFVDPVLVQKSTGMVLDGHLRVELALRTNQPTIPVKYVDLTDAEAALVLATFDPISALAYADASALDALLREVSTSDAAVMQMLSDLAEENGVVGFGGSELLTDPDEVPEPPVDPITLPGDLWLLGKHRLLCGDSTNAADVKHLLGNVIPALTVTDPPYGVEYKPDWRSSLDQWNRATNEVTNDDRVDWSAAFSLVPSDVVYCWHADRHASEVQRSLESAEYEIRSQIIWAKPHFALSRGHYHWQHEPCWYAVRKGRTAHWIGDHSQATLWQIDNATFQGSLGADDASTGHGTQKPVECMERPIRNHEGDVYDPFLGSGTTLIAAERQGRTCYGMEISPAYCDVIVTRFENATGQTATRESVAMAAD